MSPAVVVIFMSGAAIALLVAWAVGRRAGTQDLGPDMAISIECRGPIDVLRYSGKHACRREDHQQDRRVHDYISDRVHEGQRRYLLDVRDLCVMYGSGLDDLVQSWSPANRAKARIALLWHPNDWRARDPRYSRFDRWASLQHELPLNFPFHPFTVEDEAIAFLLSDVT